MLIIEGRRCRDETTQASNVTHHRWIADHWHGDPTKSMTGALTLEIGRTKRQPSDNGPETGEMVHKVIQ